MCRGVVVLLYRLGNKIVLVLLLLSALIFLLQNSWFIKLFYPFPHQELIEKYTREYQVDPYLTLAIIKTESRFSVSARSPAGASGLMQIMPETGYWIAGQMKMENFEAEMLYRPEFNIPMGIWYMAYLDKAFQGNLPQMLAAYNAGESKVRNWLADKTWSGRQQDVGQIPYAETRRYIERVLFNYQVYKKIYQKY